MQQLTPTTPRWIWIITSLKCIKIQTLCDGKFLLKNEIKFIDDVSLQNENILQTQLARSIGLTYNFKD